MRTIAVTMCLLLSAPIWGQLPAPGPERAKQLDAILTHWESAMTQVKSLEASCERTTEDKVFKTKDIYKGTVKFLKGSAPGLTSGASLYLVNSANPKTYEYIVLSGSVFYEVSPSTQEIRVHELPQPKDGQNVENNLIGLLFGMKAAQAKVRYNIDLEHTDAHYYYLRIEAKSPNDKADFNKAQLVLNRTTYLPRQLNFEQVNGNKVTLDLPSIQTPAPNVLPADFMQPNVPGFKLNRIPATPPPNKVRSSGS